MGDLNMTPVSKRFTNFLKETNLYTYTSYKNPTFTWPTFLPGYLGIQVDHVLFSKNFKMIRKKTIDYFESDHRPLIVDLAFWFFQYFYKENKYVGFNLTNLFNINLFILWYNIITKK